MGSLQQESIYRLIPMIEHPPPKPPLFKSPHKDPPPVRRDKGTMGPAAMDKPNPAKFLRRGEGKHAANAAPKPAQPRTKVITKGSVPLSTDHGVLLTLNQKNWVRDNKVESIRDVPKKQTTEEFDYRQKKDYGKTPGYMNKVKREIAEEQVYLEQERQREEEEFLATQDRVRELTEEEKEELLTGLNAKKAELERKYTHLPIHTDTLTQKTRKQTLEAELNSVGKDIAQISKPHVYVALE